MKVVSGRVVDGKVVYEGVTMEEGTAVTGLAREEGDITLSPDKEAEWLLAIAEADRGEWSSPRKPSFIDRNFLSNVPLEARF
jgi:hypothetical protein